MASDVPEKPTLESIVVDPKTIKIDDNEVFEKLGKKRPEFEVDYNCIVVITGLPITKKDSMAKKVMKNIYLNIVKAMDVKLPTKDSISIPKTEEGVSLGMCLIEFKTALEAKTCIFNFDGNIDIFGPEYPLHIVPFSSIDKLLNLKEKPNILKPAPFVPFQREWLEWYENINKGPELLVKCPKKGASLYDIGPICGIEELKGDNPELKPWETGWSKTGLYAYAIKPNSVEIFTTTPDSSKLNFATEIELNSIEAIEFSQDDRFILCKSRDTDALWALNPPQPISEFSNRIIKASAAKTTNNKMKEENVIQLDHFNFSANGRQLMRLIPEKGVQFFSIQMGQNAKDKRGRMKAIPFYKISPQILITIPDAVKIAVSPSEETFYHVEEFRKDKYITSEKGTDETLVSVTSVVGPSLLTVFQRSSITDTNKPAKISVFITAGCTVTTMLLDRQTGLPALVDGENPYTFDKQVQDFNASSTLVSGKKSENFNTSQFNPLSNGLVIPANYLQLVANHNIFNVRYDSLINTNTGMNQLSDRDGLVSTFTTPAQSSAQTTVTNSNKDYDTIGLSYGIDWSSNEQSSSSNNGNSANSGDNATNNDTILLCVSCKVMISPFSVPGVKARRHNKQQQQQLKGDETEEQLAAERGMPIPSTTYDILSICQRLPTQAVLKAIAIAESNAKLIFSGNKNGTWFMTSQVLPSVGNGAVVSLQQSYFDGTPASFQVPRQLRDRDESGHDIRSMDKDNKDKEVHSGSSIIKTSSKGLVTLLCVGYLLNIERKPKRFVVRKLTASVTSSGMKIIKEGGLKAAEIGAATDVTNINEYGTTNITTKLPNVNIVWDKYGGHFATVAYSFGTNAEKSNVLVVDTTRCEVVNGYTIVGIDKTCMSGSPDGTFIAGVADTRSSINAGLQGVRVAVVKKEWGDDFTNSADENTTLAAFRPYPAERTISGLFGPWITPEYLAECQQEAREVKLTEELKKQSYSSDAISAWSAWRDRTAEIRTRISSYTPKMVDVTINAGSIIETSKRKMTVSEITEFM